MGIKAEEIRLGQLLEEVKGFYIPDYQRPYTWDEEHIRRLFETIRTSLNSFISSEGKEDYYAFLGAILSVSGSTELREAYQIQQNDSPSTVHALIDGQQRITSLVLLVSELYKRFYFLRKKAENLDESFKNEIIDSLISALGDAKVCLFVKNAGFEAGQENTRHEFLPKIINAVKEDIWKKYEKGSYNSAVASYLLSLSFWKGIDKIEPADELKTVLKEFGELIDTYITGENDNTPLNIEKILGSKELQERLLYRSITENLKNLLVTTEYKKLIIEFITLSVIFRFIKQYIIFAKIEVEKENLAFDIFDSLNSTGDQLTAFETFRPSVIKHLRDRFRGSDEERFLKNYSDYISKEKGADRHVTTKEFIISLALYEDGTQLGKSLNEQRKHLKTTYEKRDNIEKRKFCESIYLLTEFYRDIWDKNISSLSGDYNSKCKLSLAVLIDTGHTITIPVLARYYSELILVDDDNANNYEKFSAISQSIVVFSLFWRILHNGSTAGIEDVYRELLEKNISRVKISNDIKNFDLNNFFREKLEEKKLGKSNKKQNFVNIVSGSQYSQTGNNRWLKFFMLGALHDTIPDKLTGLDKKSTGNKRPTLKFEVWKSIETLTIEHIAPQKQIENSSRDLLLLNPNNADSIGNLTLLPKISNSIIGNKEWEDKQEFYNVLSLDDPEERINRIKEKLNSEKLTKATKDYLKNTNYWPCVEALAKCNQKWTPALVQERAKRLSELAWDNLSPWLGY